MASLAVIPSALHITYIYPASDELSWHILLGEECRAYSACQMRNGLTGVRDRRCCEPRNQTTTRHFSQHLRTFNHIVRNVNLSVSDSEDVCVA